MITKFAVGQRWISDTETNLGLGTIIDEELRQITVLYLATGDTRIYAKETAPLTRVAFTIGDRVSSHHGWEMTVDRVEDDAGILTYVGQRADNNDTVVLPESELNNFLQFRSPRDRLFAGLLDGHRWFALRRQVFELRHALAQSPIRGLQGARISLLPHQIYIAVESVKRHQPRVLLADEVGLGKTIEAGLILHSQLVNQQVARVLIIVPAPLLHQWLVEMLRKFNLSFHIMDKDRFDELQPSAPDDNPFLAEQLVLCSLDTLLHDEHIADAALAAGWDMLITDEAHHLRWEPDQPSPAYSLVAELAALVPSVLLLTATPEQLGQAGHFARLQLLDPARYGELDTFLNEEAAFSWVAEVTDCLSQDRALSAEQVSKLENALEVEFSTAENTTLRSSAALSMSDMGPTLISKLIDRHGTGRLLFRNTRQAIPGFPDRSLHTHRLEKSGLAVLNQWLIDFLAAQFPEKVLLICEKRSTVEALAELLRQAGVATAQFHEGMSIVERDRAAAWFADPDEECRLLICSEIGSEGRNFQFLHHLITFELPRSPDLLEQRIGRLDRIGQQHDVDIHVPYCEGSIDHSLLRWYQEGLNAFESICRTGYAVIEQLGDQLYETTHHAEKAGNTHPDLDDLIESTKTLSNELEATLEVGRDKLLELNSNRPEQIQEHVDAFARAERDYRLQDFMLAVFDRFGVNVEEQTDNWILHPGDHMHVERFPLLPDTGMTVTFNRETALRREDYHFLSWDHPMVTAAMDLILDEGYGQADSRVVRVAELPQGLAFVEATYIMQCVAEKKLNIERYLPASLQTFYVGVDGKNYTDDLQNINLDSTRQHYERKKLKQVVLKNRDLIDRVIERTASVAQENLPDFILEARDHIEQEFTSERERLVALQKVNPAVHDDEIIAHDAKRVALQDALSGAQVIPVSIRVLFNN